MTAQGPSAAADDGMRLDKWLWQARFFKTRALAAELAERRKIRIHRLLITQAHFRPPPPTLGKGSTWEPLK